MYCSSPLISSLPSSPNNLHPFRHPSSPFTFLHHHRRRIRPVRPINFTLKVNISNFSSTPTKNNLPNNENPLPLFHLSTIAKPIASAIFVFAIGLCPFPFRPFQPPPAHAISFSFRRKKPETKELSYTEMLLLAADELGSTVDKFKEGKGNLKQVALALKNVRFLKKKLSDKIKYQGGVDMGVLEYELDDFLKRADEIENLVKVADYDCENLVADVEDGEDDPDKVKGIIGNIVQLTANNVYKYDFVADKIVAIEVEMERKDIAVEIALEKLNLIERKCKMLVDDLTRNLRKKRIPIPSASRSSLTKLSKSEIQKGLQSAQRQFWEQKILPRVVANEDVGNSFDQESMEFAQRLKQALEQSREVQKNLKVQGLPEVELKWMFGDKEVVVPNAVKIHLFNGWRKWQEESKDELKRNLLENVEIGKKYVAERQERILLERDKVMTGTWFNEEENRWEINPAAVSYAVSRNLVESAQIRYDGGAMYLTLKGDEKMHYVDLKEFERLFKDFGGFHGLYLQMVAAGTPMAVQLMVIPFSKLHPDDMLLILKRISQKCLIQLWKSKILSYRREQLFRFIRNTIDDLLVVAIIPAIDFINPYLETTPWGMALLSYADESFNWSFFYSKWQYDMGRSFRSRNKVGIIWYMKFFVRAYVCGLAVFFALSLFTGLPTGFRSFLRERQNQVNLARVKTYLKYRRLRLKRRFDNRKDPIIKAFDRMKRVKNPPIRLEDFANIESMREEVNEVVAFLQNPDSFHEMGARAPRGVLIVGESGSGKTSLALAMAAEAKVPVVRVQAERLEAGSMVGQGASNIRELFQTARELAPVIIFVEDFDIFAGIRGKHLDTRKQDHEAFINQLLVELDGFQKQEGVVLMATTESVNKIDKALTRPGRMDRIFYLQRPTQGEREKILQSSAKDNMDEELVDFVDWEKVAEKTVLMRPLELRSVPLALEASAYKGKFLDAEELVSYCNLFMTLNSIVPTWVRKIVLSKRISKVLVNHLGLRLTKEDMENVVDLMEPHGVISSGIELAIPPSSWTRETKFSHAVWAAGRGLVAALLPNFDVVHNLWLEHSSYEGVAFTKFTKEEHGGYREGIVESRSYLEKRLVFFFGSRVAAQLLLPFGEENLLSSSELQQAQELATRMVIEYGWGPSDNPTAYYHNSPSTLSLGDTHFYEIASNVERLYYLAYDKAKAILQSNRSVLEKMVEELVEFDVLDRKDLERIISEHGGTREIEPFFLSKSSDDERPQPLFKSLLENGSVSATELVRSQS